MILNQIQEEFELPSSDICTYWPVNPAFDLQRFLLQRLFFLSGDRTKYVSVGFYPSRDHQTLVEFGAIRSGGSKSLILADEQVDTWAGCLPAIRVSMCFGGDRVIKCENGNLSLHKPRRNGLARLYVGTEFISLTQPDMD